MTVADLTERGAIVVDDDGAVTFAGETGDLPLLASAILAPVSEAVAAVDPPAGTVVWTFPPGEPKNGELTDEWRDAVDASDREGQAGLGAFLE